MLTVNKQCSPIREGRQKRIFEKKKVLAIAKLTEANPNSPSERFRKVSLDPRILKLLEI